MLQFDRNKSGYLSPASLLEEIQRLYPQPLETATACHLVLESLKKALDDIQKRILLTASRALKISFRDVESAGITEARRAWMEQASNEIRDELSPETTITSMMETFGGRIDEDPTTDLLEEIKQREAELPERLRLVEPHWSFVDIALAIANLVARTGYAPELIEELHSLHDKFRAHQNYITFFKIRAESVGATSSFLNFSSIGTTPEEVKATKALNRNPQSTPIPLACDETEFTGIVERLCDAELLYPNQVSDPYSAFYAHFSFRGKATPAPLDSEFKKITWRGSVFLLIGFFDWLVANEKMSEREALRSSSLISHHFTRNGFPISRGTLNTEKANMGNNYEKRAKWQKQINQIIQ